MKRNFQGNSFFAAGFFEVLLALLEAGGLPRFDDAAGDGEGAIGQGEGFVDFDDSTEATASGTGTEWVVEREEGRSWGVKVTLITGAVVSVGVELKVGRVLDKRDGGDSFSVAEGGGDRLDQSGLRGTGEGEAILDYGDEEVLFGRGLGEGVGEGFESGRFVEAFGFALKKDTAESLAGEKSGGFIGGSFLRKRNLEKEPGVLVGVFFE